MLIAQNNSRSRVGKVAQEDAPTIERNPSSADIRPGQHQSDALIADGLSVWYGRFLALDRVSLAVPANRVTAVIGRAGTGKSTLLAALGGVLDCVPGVRVEGRVLFEGVDILREPESHLRRGIALVGEAPSLSRTATIFDAVAGPLLVHGCRDTDELADRVQAALCRVGLWREVSSDVRRTTSTLQPGQLYRLCMARALAPEPGVLLLDEPRSWLTRREVSALEEAIHGIKASCTVVFATQSIQQAMRLSDAIVCLATRDDGTGESLGNWPAHSLKALPPAERRRFLLAMIGS